LIEIRVGEEKIFSEIGEIVANGGVGVVFGSEPVLIGI
jgi:hypothetical protein